MPSRFAQTAEKCSFDSEPENTSPNDCAEKRHYKALMKTGPGCCEEQNRQSDRRPSVNVRIVLAS
jgi:hypothetical protein